MHLVVALNKDTLCNLDTYIMLQGREKIARLETMPDSLWHITYVHMLSYLKQRNLRDLAK